MNRKQLTLFRALYPRSNVDRLYVDSITGRKELASKKDLVSQKEKQLNLYSKVFEESAIRPAAERSKSKTESRQSCVGK